MINARLLSIATVAVLAAGLTACSGGEPQGGGPSSRADELRLGYFPNFTHAPALIGVEDGTFEEALGDTTLKPSIFNAGPEATEALLSESIDAAFIGPGPTTNAYVQSKAIRVIAGTAANGAALVVRPEITSAAQLKGTTLATPQLGNTQDVALRYWLQEQGLKTTTTGGGDVEIAPQSNSEAVNAFKQGQIDGAWVPEPFATQLQQAGAKVLVDETDLWPNGRFVVTNLVVRQGFLEQYPGTVDDLLGGLLDVEAAIEQDPAAAQATTNAAIEQITGTPIAPEVLEPAWENVEFTVDPVASSLVEGARHAEAVELLEGADDLSGLYALDPLNAILAERGEEEVSAS